MTSQVKHSMQFMAQHLVIVNMIQTVMKHEKHTKQHFQRRYASTELEINKLNDWH